jgi:hypothetical protein
VLTRGTISPHGVLLRLFAVCRLEDARTFSCSGVGPALLLFPRTRSEAFLSFKMSFSSIYILFFEDDAVVVVSSSEEVGFWGIFRYLCFFLLICSSFRLLLPMWKLWFIPRPLKVRFEIISFLVNVTCGFRSVGEIVEEGCGCTKPVSGWLSLFFAFFFSILIFYFLCQPKQHLKLC